MDTYRDILDGHYGQPDLADRILAALRAAGLDTDNLDIDQLAALDEFHTGGRGATLELLALADPPARARILDLGCGVGGPARVLASRVPDASVVAMDIVDEYCRSARLLNRLTRLDDRVDVRLQNLRELAPSEEGFDLVWSQHVLMNIPDKNALLDVVRRSFRDGRGTLAFHEAFGGEHAPVIMPVPWASESDHSFPVESDAWRESLTAAGFRERHWRETTADAVDWIDRTVAAKREAKRRDDNRLALSQALLMGPDAALKSRNVRRNLDEGRIRLFMGVFDVGN